MMEFITYMALNIFGPFMLEVTLACFLLTKNKKNFRFKPYISIPIGLKRNLNGCFKSMIIPTTISTANDPNIKNNMLKFIS